MNLVLDTRSGTTNMVRSELAQMKVEVMKELEKEEEAWNEVSWRATLDMEMGVEGVDDICGMEESTKISLNRKKMELDGMDFHWEGKSSKWVKDEE